VSNTSARPYLKLGCILQRPILTFPNSWPGVGLLLLRVCLGVALICPAIAGLSGTLSEPIAFAQNSIAIVGAIFLIAGLWTPLMGTLAALDEVWIALSLYAYAERTLGFTFSWECCPSAWR